MEKFQNQCKWAIPDANEDMTVFYHCISPNAIRTLKQHPEFEACLCLGCTDTCISKKINKKKA